MNFLDVFLPQLRYRIGEEHKVVYNFVEKCVLPVQFLESFLTYFFHHSKYWEMDQPPCIFYAVTYRIFSLKLILSFLTQENKNAILLT